MERDLLEMCPQQILQLRSSPGSAGSLSCNSSSCSSGCSAGNFTAAGESLCLAGVGPSMKDLVMQFPKLLANPDHGSTATQSLLDAKQIFSGAELLPTNNSAMPSSTLPSGADVNVPLTQVPSSFAHLIQQRGSCALSSNNWNTLGSPGGGKTSKARSNNVKMPRSGGVKTPQSSPLLPPPSRPPGIVQQQTVAHQFFMDGDAVDPKVGEYCLCGFGTLSVTFLFGTLKCWLWMWRFSENLPVCVVRCGRWVRNFGNGFVDPVWRSWC